MTRFLRQTLVVARRDFVAIVYTPTFLLFLLAPLLMVGFGAIGGAGAASLADRGDTVRLVAIASGADAQRLVAADRGLRNVFRNDEAPAPLLIVAPAGDPARQARAQFDREDIEASAVLSGPLATPDILHARRGARSAAYLGQLANAALLAERADASGPVSTPRIRAVAIDDGGQGNAQGREAAAFFAVFAMFLITVLLASQAAGMLAEERGNKVIEVLAASVPLEAVFLGKLLGLLGVALVFITFWGVMGGQALLVLPPELTGGGAIRPAVGLPTFILLFPIYALLSFLLLSALFLGLGAQASTMREIQMLSLPITLGQVGMFALSAAAAAKPGSTVALVAEIFPFSSPFAMAARAANDPAIWPHLLAIPWQLLWVAVVVWLSARLFRFGVLSSGGGFGVAGLFAKLRRKPA